MSKLWYPFQIRVRYQETDQMGVVYHGNYINWFEIGRTEWIRTQGMTYHELEAKGLLLPLVDLQMSFKQPAKYDDFITLYTRVTDFTNIRVTFESQVRRGISTESIRPISENEELPGEQLVTGMTKHVWVNPKFRPVRLDRVMPELYAILKQ